MNQKLQQSQANPSPINHQQPLSKLDRSLSFLQSLSQDKLINQVQNLLVQNSKLNNAVNQLVVSKQKIEHERQQYHQRLQFQLKRNQILEQDQKIANDFLKQLTQQNQSLLQVRQKLLCQNEQLEKVIKKYRIGKGDEMLIKEHIKTSRFDESEDKQNLKPNSISNSKDQLIIQLHEKQKQKKQLKKQNKKIRQLENKLLQIQLELQKTQSQKLTAQKTISQKQIKIINIQNQLNNLKFQLAQEKQSLSQLLLVYKAARQQIEIQARTIQFFQSNI